MKYSKIDIPKDKRQKEENLKKNVILTALTMAMLMTSTMTVNAKTTKDVNLVIDGVVSNEKVKAETVGDIIEDNNVVEETEQDKVKVLNKNKDDKVENGDTIRLASEKKINLVVDGKTEEVKTHAIDVKELTEEKNIKYIKSINVPEDEKLETGMSVNILTEKRKTTQDEQEIPYKTKIVYDFSMKVGEEKKEEGQTGLIKNKSMHRLVNGELQSELLSSETIREVKDEIITKGSKLVEEEEIDFKTKKVEDDSLPESEEVIEQEGKKGKKEIIYKKEDKEKEKIEEKVIDEPVDKIVKVGTKVEKREFTIDTNSAKEEIARRESGGSYSARNGRYIGRYQLDSAYLNGDHSPENQERVAERYVANRYGSWQNALSFWDSHGWY